MNPGGLDGSEASSSSYSPHQDHQNPLRSNPHEHDPNNDTFSGADENDDSLLSEDPLQGELGQPITFKRSKQKRSFFDFAQPTRLITNLTGGDARAESSGVNRGEPPTYTTIEQHNDGVYMESIHTSPRRRGGAGGGGANGTTTSKDGLPLDWHIEGPGRRVGYEDLTAIDWIFEYTKERTRLRNLRESAKRWHMGTLHLAFDAAQEWMVLVMTGLLTGTLAAFIDITTDWLGDLKAGYCGTNDGGAFYLNKSFCCLGYDEGAQCMGWRPWAAALDISSAAGKWIIEYFFFIMFSVCLPWLLRRFDFPSASSDSGERYFLRLARALW